MNTKNDEKENRSVALTPHSRLIQIMYNSLSAHMKSVIERSEPEHIIGHGQVVTNDLWTKRGQDCRETYLGASRKSRTSDQVSRDGP